MHRLRRLPTALARDFLFILRILSALNPLLWPSLVEGTGATDADGPTSGLLLALPCSVVVDTELIRTKLRFSHFLWE